MEKTARLLQRVADLLLENRRLKDILKLNGIDFDLDDSRFGLVQKDGGAHGMMGPVKSVQISVQNYNLFTSMFKGRSDVFSKRSARPDPKTGKCGYYVQKDYSLPNKTNRPLTNRELLNHLKGSKLDCSDVIGIYPMLPDETCYFLVFDFDDHSNNDGQRIINEVDTLRKTCKDFQIDHLVERSRSGKGYHIWFFFEEAVPAYIVREFGAALLLKSSERISFADFKTFDP